MPERRILVLHGPNLNMLGKREPAVYGKTTLAEIDAALEQAAAKLGCAVETFQSNHEGELVDLVQQRLGQIDGVIINPGALTHYGLSLRDALAMLSVPIIEVHLTNIHAREEWRSKSVVAPLARGQIAGLGWRGYLLALDYLAQELQQ
ncbi:MAG: type II 3-dehydroquinate dehydratase [Chloroflexi bacterium]|nr:type II 3-dehydroquinate dehydratase [Chloroflexota bacterium]